MPAIWMAMERFPRGVSESDCRLHKNGSQDFVWTLDKNGREITIFEIPLFTEFRFYCSLYTGMLVCSRWPGNWHWGVYSRRSESGGVSRFLTTVCDVGAGHYASISMLDETGILWCMFHRNTNVRKRFIHHTLFIICGYTIRMFNESDVSLLNSALS